MLFELTDSDGQRTLLSLCKFTYIVGRDAGYRKYYFSKGKVWLDKTNNKDNIKINGDKGVKVRQGTAKQQGLIGLYEQIKKNVDEYIHGCNTCCVESSHAQRLALTDKRLDKWKEWGPATRFAYSRINDGPTKHLMTLFSELSLPHNDTIEQRSKEREMKKQKVSIKKKTPEIKLQAAAAKKRKEENQAARKKTNSNDIYKKQKTLTNQTEYPCPHQGCTHPPFKRKGCLISHISKKHPKT